MTSSSLPSMVCPEDGERLVERTLGGEAHLECGQCGAAVFSRAALGRLRDKAAASLVPIALPVTAGAPRAADPGGKPSLKQKCPVCQSRLLSHAFGGGNVRVRSCDECALVFLGPAAIAGILKEARDGIEMSEDARAALHQQRMMAAGNRYLAAELGAGTVVLGGLLTFFRYTLRSGFSPVVVGTAAVIAIGVTAFGIHKLRRQRAEAAAKMERLAEAELYRHEQKAREKATSAPALPSPAAPVLSSPSTPVPDSAPRSPAVAPVPPAAAARTGKARKCPVCRASLPAGTTHCSSCDSDFG